MTVETMLILLIGHRPKHFRAYVEDPAEYILNVRETMTLLLLLLFSFHIFIKVKKVLMIDR